MKVENIIFLMRHLSEILSQEVKNSVVKIDKHCCREFCPK